VVVTYLDTASALKVLANIRAHAPGVPVIVRTVDDRDIEKLQAAGATEVVPEAIEGSLMLASHALALVGVPMRRVIHLVQAQRDARYKLLRGYFHGADDDTVDEIDQERLSSITLPPALRPGPVLLRDVGLGNVAVQVMSLRRSDGSMLTPQEDSLIEAGDTLVLSGTPEALALAEEMLLRGRSL
jgi:CPA2 family monovalent cation:H+ antiporter-2